MVLDHPPKVGQFFVSIVDGLALGWFFRKKYPRCATERLAIAGVILWDYGYDSLGQTTFYAQVVLGTSPYCYPFGVLYSRGVVPLAPQTPGS